MRLMKVRLLVTLAFASTVCASSGDRSDEFLDCVKLCRAGACSSNDSSGDLSLALRLTRWTCEDNCKYSCMHIITNRAVERGGWIHQYYGKWPFWRLAGMQEPASVLFSLLNLYGHVDGLRKLQRIKSYSHPMRPYYLLWSWVNINAWIWSAVFHTRGSLVSILALIF